VTPDTRLYDELRVRGVDVPIAVIGAAAGKGLIGAAIADGARVADELGRERVGALGS